MGLFFNYDPSTGRFSSLDEPTEAERRASMSEGLFGSPNAVRVDGTMQSAEFDAQGNPINQQMTAQQPRYENTGLFQGLSPEQVPQMTAAKQMMQSGDPLLQKQSLSMLDELTQAQGNPTELPSTIQEWNLFNSMTPEKQQSYMNMKRGNSKVVIVDGVPTVVNMNQPEGADIGAEALTTVEEQAAGAAQVAGTVEGSKTKAKTRVTRLDKQVNDAFLAADGMGVLNRSIGLLSKGIETGGWDAVSLYAKQKFGVEGADEGELSNLMGKAVLAQLRDTFGAAFTAKEGDSLKVIEAGFGKSPRANLRLLNNALSIAKRAAERGIGAARELKDDFAIKQLEDAMRFELTGGSGLPDGATEDDITETMRSNNMTREQVIQRLNSGR